MRVIDTAAGKVVGELESGDQPHENYSRDAAGNQSRRRVVSFAVRGQRR